MYLCHKDSYLPSNYIFPPNYYVITFFSRFHQQFHGENLKLLGSVGFWTNHVEYCQQSLSVCSNSGTFIPFVSGSAPETRNCKVGGGCIDPKYRLGRKFSHLISHPLKKSLSILMKWNRPLLEEFSNR